MILLINHVTGILLKTGLSGGGDLHTYKCYIKIIHSWIQVFGIDVLLQQMQLSVEMQNANLNSQLLFSMHLLMYTNWTSLFVLSI